MNTERTSTAVVNAFVGPTVEQYLSRLDETLRNKGLTTPLLVLQAGGGVTDTSEAVPVRTIESGPAAGMVAVKSLADTIGKKNVLATDVGGTTFKVGLLIDGQWSVSRETIINQYSLLIPAIDLVSIGAGGGSIAWVDDTRLRVGPLSAGSDPGPACYGWGGTRPTVTDADLALGFLNPERFLGGRLKVDSERAEAAIKEHIADPLFDGDVIASAAAIRKIVDAQMADLLHKQTIQRGHDPRSFVLMAYGGAGPLHAAAFARAWTWIRSSSHGWQRRTRRMALLSPTFGCRYSARFRVTYSTMRRSSCPPSGNWSTLRWNVSISSRSLRVVSISPGG